MAFDPAKIEEKLDKAMIAGVEIDNARLGLEVKTLVEVMEVAKFYSLSKQAIPLYMRNEPGICAAVLMRSIRWGLDFFFCAEQSYLVKNPKTGEEKIAYMAQLLNAVINKAEPLILEGKLRVRYEGDGDGLKAFVFGIPKGEVAPIEYETPTLGARIKAVGRNESGYLKGSPLYDQDPKQALWYFGSRAFIRRHFPHVLAGVYTQEEMQEAGWERMKDVTPQRETDPAKPAVRSLADSLRERKAKHGEQRRGFDPAHIERETAKTGGAKEDAASGDVEVKKEDDNGGQTEDGGADTAGRVEGGVQQAAGNASGDVGGNADDASTRGGDDSGDREDAGPVASGDTQEAGQQQELLPPEPETGRKRRTK